MTYATNTRLLRRVEQKHSKKHAPWLKAVYAMAREQKAALALAGAAQILAGTEKIKAARFAASSAGSTTEPEPRMDQAPPRSHRRIWSETVRPGPHDVLTWDEVTRVPWIEGNAEAE